LPQGTSLPAQQLGARALLRVQAQEPAPWRRLQPPLVLLERSLCHGTAGNAGALGSPLLAPH